MGVVEKRVGALDEVDMGADLTPIISEMIDLIVIEEATEISANEIV